MYTAKQLMGICNRALLSVFLLHSFAFCQTGEWQSTRGPFGGTINALMIDQRGNLFAATENAGVFSSAGAAESWQQSDSEMNAQDVNALATTGENAIIAGTDDGIFRSTDGGVTWGRPTGGLEAYASFLVTALGVGPAGEIYAATVVRFRSDSSDAVIFWSTDEGTSWIRTANGLSATALGFLSTGELIAGGRGAGVQMSSDRGDTWVPIRDVPRETFRTLLIAPGDQIFVGAGRGAIDPNTPGLFRSSDVGQAWDDLSAGLAPDVYALAIDSQGTLYAGTGWDGLFSSSDNGETWSQILTTPDTWNQSTPGPLGWRVNAIAISSEDVLFTGMHKGTGVMRSDDGGASWNRQISGMTNPYTRSYAFASDGTIYVGTGDGDLDGVGGSGLFQFDRTSETWAEISRRIPLAYIRAIAVGPNHSILASGWPGGVYRSTDRGESWVQVDTTFRFSAFVFSSNGSVFADGKTGIYRSDNLGDSWTLFESGLRGDNFFPLGVSDENHIYANSDLGLFVSIDNGETWQQIYSQSIWYLAIGSSGRLYGSRDMTLIRSVDGGNTWETVQIDFQNKSFGVQAVDTRGNVYTTVWGDGIYRSTDDGETWQPFNEGLEGANASVGLAPDGELFAFTQRGSQRGVFRYVETSTGVKSSPSLVPSMLTLEQNYPNPFNPATTIRFALPEPAFVRLQVLDIAGREVATLIEGHRPAGEATHRWIANTVASGVYFYRLTAGAVVRTRKMVLLR